MMSPLHFSLSQPSQGERQSSQKTPPTSETASKKDRFTYLPEKPMERIFQCLSPTEIMKTLVSAARIQKKLFDGEKVSIGDIACKNRSDIVERIFCTTEPKFGRLFTPVVCNSLTTLSADGDTLQEVVRLFPNLQKLVLSVDSNVDLSILQSLPQLQFLEVSAHIGNKGLKQIAQLKSMHTVRIWFLKNSPKIDLSLFKDSSITRLDLISCPHQTLQAVGTLTKLTELYLSSCAFTPDDLKHVQALGSLQKLTIENIPQHSKHMTDACMEIISEMKSLEAINLEGNTHITENGFRMLEKLPKLKIINLSYTEATDDTVQYLRSKLPNLKELLCKKHTKKPKKNLEKAVE